MYSRFCSASAHCGIPSVLCQEVFYESLDRVCPLVCARCAVVPMAVSSLCTFGASALLGGESMSLGLFLVIACVLAVIVFIAFAL